MRNGRATSSCQELHLPRWGQGGPNKLYSDKQTTATLHAINLLWTKAPFLRHRLC